jgi:hypothetical protein
MCQWLPRRIHWGWSRWMRSFWTVPFHMPYLWRSKRFNKMYCMSNYITGHFTIRYVDTSRIVYFPNSNECLPFGDNKSSNNLKHYILTKCNLQWHHNKHNPINSIGWLLIQSECHRIHEPDQQHCSIQLRWTSPARKVDRTCKIIDRMHNSNERRYNDVERAHSCHFPANFSHWVWTNHRRPCSSQHSGIHLNDRVRSTKLNVSQDVTGYHNLCRNV